MEGMSNNEEHHHMKPRARYPKRVHRTACKMGDEWLWTITLTLLSPAWAALLCQREVWPADPFSLFLSHSSLSSASCLLLRACWTLRSSCARRVMPSSPFPLSLPAPPPHQRPFPPVSSRAFQQHMRASFAACSCPSPLHDRPPASDSPHLCEFDMIVRES